MKKRDNVYIIPTRYGMMYAVGILITLMAGAIYANNLVYLLSFFLVALFLIGMVQTNTNLKKIDFEKIQINLVEEKGRGSGVLWLKSWAKEDHHQVLVRLKTEGLDQEFLIDKISSGTLSPYRFSLKGEKVGCFKVKRIALSSVFPFGMFHSWRNFASQEAFYVYPAPEGRSTLPEETTIGESLALNIGQSGDDYSQHKMYEEGHSQRHIDWKAVARGRPKMLKEFKDGQRDSFRLKISDAKGDKISKLRQLSKWIHMCNDRQISYSLDLGSFNVQPNLGFRHKNKCLRMLAEFGDKSA